MFSRESVPFYTLVRIVLSSPTLDIVRVFRFYQTAECEITSQWSSNLHLPDTFIGHSGFSSEFLGKDPLAACRMCMSPAVVWEETLFEPLLLLFSVSHAA